MEAFKPINGLTYIVAAAGGQGLTKWASPIDANSAFRKMHFGILSAQYDASARSLAVNLLCGAKFPANDKDPCTYGSTLWSTTFTSQNTPPQPSQPKLNVAVSDDVSTAENGQSLSYTATVTNNGTATATGVNLTVALPSNATFVAADDGVVPSNGSLNWNLDYVGAGRTVTKHFTVLANSAVAGDKLVVTANVTSADSACQNSGSSCAASDTDTIVVQPAFVQWIGNQSVETNLTEWGGIYNQYSLNTRVVDDSYDGNASLQVVRSSGSGYAGVNDKPKHVTSTAAGKTYTASVWVRGRAIGQKITLQVKEVDASNTTVSLANTTLTTADTNWHQLTVNYTVQRNGGQLAYMLFSPNSTTTNWFRADMMSLTSAN